MNDNKPNALLSSAECADRTGLSTKALRVYERYGLIAPKRASNGWRDYDAADLERLNAISLLKAMGLTLKQIRTVLTDGSLPLKQVLAIQIEACKKRRLDAERSEMIAMSALQRLEERQELTIEELCSLVRGTCANSIPLQVQQLLDKHMSADEQAEWRQGLTRTRQGLDDMKAYADAQRENIFVPLKALIDAGVQPTAPEVQALIEQNDQLMTQFAVRERLVKAYDLNPANFGNALNVGRDLMRASKADPAKYGDQLPNTDIVSFFYRAATMSTPGTRIERLLTTLQQVRRSDNTQTREVLALVEEFCEICEQHHLGSPLVYAKWMLTQRAGLNEIADKESTDAWTFLVGAIEQRSSPSQLSHPIAKI
jgi:DNA-binding transcriptional MerR regulator